MDEELVSALAKVLQKDRFAELKTLGNDGFIVQYKDTTIRLSEEAFLKLVDDDESRRLVDQFRKRCDDEYILVAYHGGKVVGTKVRL